MLSSQFLANVRQFSEKNCVFLEHLFFDYVLFQLAVHILSKAPSFLPGTDVMILKIFFPKISAKKLAFLTQNKAKLCKILIITLVFEKNVNFFLRKLSKIAENCDHNIDPWSFGANIFQILTLVHGCRPAKTCRTYPTASRARPVSCSTRPSPSSAAGSSSMTSRTFANATLL
jgi:hypothetical protein